MGKRGALLFDHLQGSLNHEPSFSFPPATGYPPVLSISMSDLCVLQILPGALPGLVFTRGVTCHRQGWYRRSVPAHHFELEAVLPGKALGFCFCFFCILEDINFI